MILIRTEFKRLFNHPLPLSRYLGLPTPEDNLRGYQASDVNAKAKKLANKKFLMVHGTADDNVHYQQSMMLSRALEEADVLFKSVYFYCI